MKGGVVRYWGLGLIGIAFDITSCSSVGQLPSGESGGLETKVGLKVDLAGTQGSIA